MIKLFGKYRLHLIVRNKFIQYLFYAIGEIVLVVIGILIAIKVNNWNAKEIQLLNGKTLMFEIKSEINQDIDKLEKVLVNLNERLEIQERLFKREDFSTVDSDSLHFLFNIANVDIKSSKNTYNKVINQGITILTEDPDLNTNIFKFYNETMLRFDEFFEYQWLRLQEREKFFRFEREYSYESQKISGFRSIERNEIKGKIVDFINLPKTRNVILESYWDGKNSLEKLKQFLRESKHLVNEIEMELLENE